MKTKFFFDIPFIFIVSIFICACNGNHNSSYTQGEGPMQGDSSLIVQNNDNMQVPVEPPVTAEKDSIAKVLSSQSPFLMVGCCAEENMREEVCCCEVVLEEYKILVEKKDPKLAAYNMQDPILGNCKRRLREAFDKIDNPPTEEQESYDDLY